jgi:DHA2 family multidrug resistance protein
MARGVDAVTSRETALRALDGVVQRQATLLSFDRVFLVAGLAFLGVLPLLAYLKTPKDKSAGPTKVEVHLE